MVGENIIKAREKAGLSQTELAEKIGVSRHLMYKYEHGVISNIPYAKIIEIAQACHTDPMTIMGWDVQEEGQQSYYTNDETVQIAQEVYENPELKLVFDACKGLTPEQIKAAAAMLNTFKGDK